MSERVFALLLRLYPAHFRAHYREEYLQLIRDRSRDETGTWQKIRLWFDLLVDLAISLPREYRRVGSEWIGGSTQQCVEGTPVFVVFGSQSPGRTCLLLGAVLSLLMLAAFPSLINHFGKIQPPPGWNVAFAGAYTRQPAEMRQQASENSRVATFTKQDADPRLDAAARRRIITNAIIALKQHHIDPVVAQKAADALLTHERNGDDDSLTTAAEFARVLTTQMRDATDDQDLELLFTRRTIPERPSRLSAPLPPGYADQIRRINCGFERVEVFPGNIGYVKLNAFGDTSVCETTARQAMSRINSANAVVFDLRDNRGGFGSMVKLLSAYLFDHPEYLFSPIESTTRESWTNSPVPGNKLADKPVYILTSSRTISAAENFTYNLKMLKRATVVGEVTAGAAHAANLHSIGDNFYLATIEVRAINPYSNHDWNGTGIQPHVKVSAADALNAALKLVEPDKIKMTRCGKP
jgi:Peptidase family S41